MKRFFHNFRFAMLGVSILCIGLGLAVILWPDQAMKILCYGFGGVLVVSGLLQIVSFTAGDRSSLLHRLMLVSGIVSAVAGVFVILVSPSQVRTLTLIVMGIVLLYHGAMDVKYGFDIKNCNGRTWGVVMFFGIATCAMGVLMLVDPFQDEGVLFFIAGLGFLFDGLTDLFTVFAVAGSKARYERLAGAAPVIELEPGAAETLSVDGNSTDTPVLSESAQTDLPEDGTPAQEEPVPAEEAPAPAEEAPAPAEESASAEAKEE